MATSGTNSFTLDLGDIIEEAYERTGVEFRGGYQYKTARRSLDLLMLEWQNRGLNLWTVKNASQNLTSGTASYPLTGEKLDIIEAVLRQNTGSADQSDLTMRRVSVSEYSHITNKLTQGRPIQFFVDQSSSGITLTVWPVPDQAYTINYYYLDRIEDSGKPASNTVDMPVRYLPCLVAGLAYYLALKTPETAPMVPALKAVYDEQWSLAADASREKASLFIQPGGYNIV
jgi:hypothetical protein